MDKDDFIYGPAAELDWFSSKEARRLLSIAEDEGLIRSEGDQVELTFDYHKVNVPLGFEPSEDIFEKKKQSLFSSLLNDVVNTSNLTREKIMSKVNKKQDKLNIEIEAALLLVARELKLEIPDEEEIIEEIKKKILESN